jgi:pSer/pThr/pTyr-binding forkhead associated (FHA) protein
MELEARLKGDDGRHDIALTGTLSVGRGSDCDLTLDDAEASRLHAEFVVENGQVFVEDLNSSNGTWVNGSRVSARTGLKAGDSVLIGMHTLRLFINGEGAPAEDDATVLSHEDATVLAGSASANGAAASSALPGSDMPWADEDTGDHTVAFAVGAQSAVPAVARQDTDEAHLVIIDETGEIADVYALDSGQTVWRIGRKASCDIQLNHDTVSELHCELQNEPDKGRWRAVNSLSTNKLVVNGRECLRTYLEEGDQIRLGAITVVFFAAASGAGKAAGRRNQRGAKGGTGASSRSSLKPALLGGIGLLLVAAAALAWWLSAAWTGAG